jgi:two-component system LytT family sensor kinase
VTDRDNGGMNRSVREASLAALPARHARRYLPPMVFQLSAPAVVMVLSATALIAFHGTALAIAAASHGGSAIAGFLMAVANAAMWLVLTPFIAVMARRYRGRGMSVQLGVHAMAASGVALVAGVVHGTLASMIAVRPDIPALAAVFYYLDLHLALYLCVVLLTHAVDRNATVVASRGRELALAGMLAELRADVLTRQLHPHLLFNSLNAIAELTVEAPSAAAEMLRHLREFLGATVRPDTGNLIALDAEITTVERYLALERVRYGERLTVTIEVPPEIRRAIVPHLLLQPLVENAVRHGIARHEGDGHIHVLARADGAGHLLLRVRNSGTPHPGSGRRGFGIGLRNTRDRLECMFPQSASVNMTLEPSGAAVVEIAVPLRFASSTDSSRGPDAQVDASPAVDDVPVAHPPRRLRTTVVIPALLSLLSIFQSAQIYVYSRLRPGQAAGFVTELGYNGLWAAIWIGIAPGVWWAASRVRLQRDGALPRVAAHLALAIVLAAAVNGVFATILGRPFFHPGNINPLVLNALVYVVIVGAAHLTQLRQWLEERQLAMGHMRSSLAQQRWAAAMLDLQPDRLSRILDRIEQMLPGDATRAEQEVLRVADVLRHYLHARGPGALSLSDALLQLEVGTAAERAGT